MTKFSINTREFDALSKRVEDPKQYKPVMDAGLLFMRSKVDTEPPKAAGAFTAQATPAQKRAFWAKVRAGLARVGGSGYVRTGQTIRAWTISHQGSNAYKRMGRLGNNAPGAQWVFGQDTQQPFHATSGWPRVDKVLNENKAALIRIMNNKIKQIVEGL